MSAFSFQTNATAGSSELSAASLSAASLALDTSLNADCWTRRREHAFELLAQQRYSSALREVSEPLQFCRPGGLPLDQQVEVFTSAARAARGLGAFGNAARCFNEALDRQERAAPDNWNAAIQLAVGGFAAAVQARSPKMGSSFGVHLQELLTRAMPEMEAADLERLLPTVAIVVGEMGVKRCTIDLLHALSSRTDVLDHCAPETCAALSMLNGHLYRNTSDRELAVQHFDSVLTHLAGAPSGSPLQSAAWLMKARMLVAQPDANAAVEFLSRGIDCMPIDEIGAGILTLPFLEASEFWMVHSVYCGHGDIAPALLDLHERIAGPDSEVSYARGVSGLMMVAIELMGEDCRSRPGATEFFDSLSEHIDVLGEDTPRINPDIRATFRFAHAVRALQEDQFENAAQAAIQAADIILADVGDPDLVVSRMERYLCMLSDLEEHVAALELLERASTRAAEREFDEMVQLHLSLFALEPLTALDYDAALAELFKNGIEALRRANPADDRYAVITYQNCTDLAVLGYQLSESVSDEVRERYLTDALECLNSAFSVQAVHSAQFTIHPAGEMRMLSLKESICRDLGMDETAAAASSALAALRAAHPDLAQEDADESPDL